MIFMSGIVLNPAALVLPVMEGNAWTNMISGAVFISGADCYVGFGPMTVKRLT